MKRKINEWISMQVAKKPRQMVLTVILLFNIIFVFISAVLIRGFSLSGTEEMGFLEAVFCTITMILDAGCVQFVITDIGQAKVAVALACLCIIFIGMISFTGAVIGYVTNYISTFIDNANMGIKKLHISNHVIILNWNTRASEIINDLLYCNQKRTVVVLVDSRKAEIEKEIEERLADTITRENATLYKQCENMGFMQKVMTYKRNKLHNNITVFIREGDVFSSKQLHDISLEYARTVIILGNDVNNTICKFEHRERIEEINKGNSQTVKTLMQVADITSASYSADNQKIIVEIIDDWTWELVEKIIKCKQVDGKCNIVPVRVNRVLGQILSQFSIMPELNLAYRELFSNKGAAFFAVEQPVTEEEIFIKDYLNAHKYAIPLTFMNSKGKMHAFYAANSEKDILKCDGLTISTYKVDENEEYWIEKKNVIILGHNSKCKDIMQGFASFRGEWNYKDGSGEILKIVVIDDEKSLEKLNYYREYPFVTDTIVANIYDRELICATINAFVDSYQGDTSILILSDDAVLNEDIDANAMANLVYVQDIINAKKESDPEFEEESIDVIVEIIDPKHHDIVSSYSVNNVVISNRYISKMITQIGEKESLYDFYLDILTYDTDNSQGYQSKEIYTKKVSRFFDEIPKDCTAEEFIRAVYLTSIDSNKPIEKRNPTIALGYVKPGGEMILFGGDQSNIKVHLESKDKLIVFSNH